MASLKDLRRRIASVKNTRQITSAMKLVAASKLRRAQQAIVGARPYTDGIESLTKRVVGELLTGLTGTQEQKQAQLLSLHPLLRVPERTEESKLAVIVISSDRGLCGAYNTALTKAALKHYRKLGDQNENTELFFYGRKAFDLFRRYQIKGTLTEGFWGGSLTTSRTDKVSDEFVERFLKGEFYRVDVVFTEFKSAMTQIPQAKTVLPLQIQTPSDAGMATAAPTESAAAPKEERGFIYEPEKKQLLGALLPKQVRTQFYRLFADCFASEMGSRMTAMENATKNAGEMISKLTLSANRTRQAAITTELTEIVGGAEALKG